MEGGHPVLCKGVETVENCCCTLHAHLFPGGSLLCLLRLLLMAMADVAKHIEELKGGVSL